MDSLVKRCHKKTNIEIILFDQFVHDTNIALTDKVRKQDPLIQHKITEPKEPYLQEILSATQANKRINLKYNTSDILITLK